MSILLSQLDDENLDFTVEISVDGKKEKFEFLDIVNFSGKKYLVLAPDGEEYVEIFEIIACDTQLERYEYITDESIREAVFKIFAEKNEDEFDFF